MGLIMTDCRCGRGCPGRDFTKILTPVGAGTNLVGTESNVGAWNGSMHMEVDVVGSPVPSPTLLEPLRFEWRPNTGDIDVHNTHRALRGGMIIADSVAAASSVIEGKVSRGKAFCPVGAFALTVGSPVGPGIGFLQKISWKYAQLVKNGAAISDLKTIDAELTTQGLIGILIAAYGSAQFKTYTSTLADIDCDAVLEYDDTFGVDVWLELEHDELNPPGKYPGNRHVFAGTNGFFSQSQPFDRRTANSNMLTLSPVSFKVSCACPKYTLTWASGTTLIINGQDEEWSMSEPGDGWVSTGTCGGRSVQTSNGITWVDLRLDLERPTLAMRDPAFPGLGDVLYLAEDHNSTYPDFNGALSPPRAFSQGTWDQSALPITFVVNDDTLNPADPPDSDVMPAGWPTEITVNSP